MSSIFLGNTLLSEHTPTRNMALLKLLANWMGKIDALYIVGNLFESWMGDDFRHHVSEEIAHALSVFTTATPVYLQTGSHDFLLGTQFAARTGISLLPEVAVINAHEQTVVLTTGNQWHEMGTEAATWHQHTHSPQWQQTFLQHAIPERVRLAKEFAYPQNCLDDNVVISQLHKTLAALNLDSNRPVSVVHAQKCALLNPCELQWQNRNISCITQLAWSNEQASFWELTPKGDWLQHVSIL